MMAASQKDLRSYFKAKKHYNELSAKAKSNLVNDTDVKSELANSFVAESVVQKTPKSKIEVQKSNSRKRKLEQRESRNEGPLSKYFKLSDEKDGTSSAKKKLVMDDSESGNQLHQQLKPEEIKEKLGKCSRLDELRAKLLKLNNCDQKLKEFREASVHGTSSPSKSSSPLQSPRKLSRMSPYKLSSCVPPSPQKLKSLNPHLEHFKAIDIEVPVSPSKSPMKTLITSPAKEYCFQKYAHLTSDNRGTLVMPHRYQVIKEVFRAVDTVVSLMHNRQEIITYSKLKPAVQEMIRKTFSEKHLGQIKTVFPLAYFFKQEKLKAYHHLDDNGKSSYQLTLAANLNYKEASSVKSNLLDRFNDVSTASPVRYRKMDSLVLVDRREIFHKSLLSLVEKQHEEFLKKLNPPITLNGTLKQWHPEFPLENVAEPEPSELPKPPTIEAPSTARQLFEKATSLLSVNNRMKNAVKAAAEKSDVVEKPEPTTPLSTDPKIAAALRGVSLSLLEKIRAREAEKATREMTRTGPETVELQRLSRLPEMARIIRNFFIAEKKAAIPWDIVAGKLIASYPSTLAAHEVDAHLDLLINTVPNWCTIHKVRSGTFLKIDKTRELHNVIDCIHKIIKSKS